MHTQIYARCHTCHTIKEVEQFPEDGPKVECTPCYDKPVPRDKNELRSAVYAEGDMPDDWKEILLALYGPACLCCKEVKPLTLDHVVPISKGGLHTLSNAQLLCLRCNSVKNARFIDYRN